MIKPNVRRFIRKIHRYLGVFVGIQFLLWTLSGMYFSWTNIDDIHGDQFRKSHEPIHFENLKSPSELLPNIHISSLKLGDLSGVPYYWINDSILVNANTGNIKSEISENEALQIAKQYIIDKLEVESIVKITETNKHHEYRERSLPAYEITYKHKDVVKAYISVADGRFVTIRHTAWRWFDFLWMTHTMGYNGRDDINNLLLRIFSLLGVITVVSGFVLWLVSTRLFSKKLKE